MTDEQWKFIAPLLPPAMPGGRKRTVDLREVLNGVLYVVRGVSVRQSAYGMWREARR